MWTFLRKGTVAAEFQAISRNYAETMPFHKIFTSGNKVKLWYFMQCLWFTWCCLLIRYILILMLIYLPFRASFPDEIIYFCCHKDANDCFWSVFQSVKKIFNKTIWATYLDTFLLLSKHYLLAYDITGVETLNWAFLLAYISGHSETDSVLLRWIDIIHKSWINKTLFDLPKASLSRKCGMVKAHKMTKTNCLNLLRMTALIFFTFCGLPCIKDGEILPNLTKISAFWQCWFSKRCDIDFTSLLKVTIYVEAK